jgi:hypothetical protein
MGLLVLFLIPYRQMQGYSFEKDIRSSVAYPGFFSGGGFNKFS